MATSNPSDCRIATGSDCGTVRPVISEHSKHPKRRAARKFSRTSKAHPGYLQTSMKFIYPLWLTKIRQTIRHQPECQIPPSHRRQARSYSARCGRYSENTPPLPLVGLAAEIWTRHFAERWINTEGPPVEVAFSWWSGCGTSYVEAPARAPFFASVLSTDISAACHCAFWPSVSTT